MPTPRNRRLAIRAGLATIAAGGIVMASAPAPADAQITSFCSGVAGAVTVPGDLIIRADDWCVLEGTVVQGDVTVRRGSDLIAQGATLEGRVVAQADAFVDLEGSTVADRVVLRDAFGLLAVDSTVGGNVVARQVDPAIAPGAVLSLGSAIAGTVNAQVGAVWLGDSSVGANVVGDQAQYVDLQNTVVEGALRVSGATDGSVVCDSEVYGDAEYAGNAGAIQLGGDTTLAGCLSANYWHRNVTIDGTAGTVHVAENIVRLELVGDGNDPAPTGAGNRARDGFGGQFADLAPAPAQTLSKEPVDDRRAELEQRLEQRRDAAVRSADEIGDAAL